MMPKYLLAVALLLAGCGGPGPLLVDPEFDPAFGPSVQYHAGRENGYLVMDGVAQGLTSLEAQHVRQGKLLAAKPVELRNARFAFSIGPVENGDQVILRGENYRTVLTMTFPWGVSGL